MSKPPKVTYKQENGDDGYCYVVRVNGRAKVFGCTRKEAMYYKTKFLQEFADRAADLKRPVEYTSDPNQAIYQDLLKQEQPTARHYLAGKQCLQCGRTLDDNGNCRGHLSMF